MFLWYMQRHLWQLAETQQELKQTGEGCISGVGKSCIPASEINTLHATGLIVLSHSMCTSYASSTCMQRLAAA